MNSREFRDAIYHHLNNNTHEWAIFGNAHKYDNELTLEDMYFLVNCIHKYQPTTLGLANLKLTDQQICFIVHRLHENTSLKVLYLPFNGIGDKGAAAIADLLSTNTNIHTLNLMSNKIGNFGMTALANMLFNNSHLKDIKLFENAFNESASSYFEIALRHNTNVNTLLLYPADGGIQLKPRENYIQEQRERMMAYFRRHHLLTKTRKLTSLSTIKPEESDSHRKLIIKR